MSLVSNDSHNACTSNSTSLSDRIPAKKGDSLHLVSALYDVVMFPIAVPFSVSFMEVIGETEIFRVLNEGGTGGRQHEDGGTEAYLQSIRYCSCRALITLVRTTFHQQ